jgi:carnitine O-palmitoyltransferase 1
MSGSEPKIIIPRSIAGPSFRWGNTATLVTATLSILLLLALAVPDATMTILSIGLQVIGAVAVLAYILLSVQFLRISLLKLLLKWSGWAYRPQSNFTRLYLGVVGALGGSKPKLWELQGTLPPLPVPNLQKSLDNYLDSVQPLLSPEDFEKTKRAVSEFRKPGGIGEKLQALLIQRAKTEKTSWLLEWWEKIIYLKGRLPLPIFSNWYGLDRVDPLLRSQPARAANLVNGLLMFKRMLETQALEPNRVQGTVPLCMWQYSRIFGTVRIPGEEEDYLETHSKSKHIVVICKDRYFKVNLYDSDGPISVTDI